MKLRRYVNLVLTGIILVFCILILVDARNNETIGKEKTIQPKQYKGDVNMEKATFAAGCFWGVEEAFRNAKGVLGTTVGYIGGWLKNPTYKDVCSGKTGHAEAVEVVYDPEETSYNKLLELFWDIHNPTTLNRQGPDIGEQYRSAIFFHTSEQEALAVASKKKLEQNGRLKKPIVTEITAATQFFPAEEYHQQYLEKRKLKQCH